MSVLLAVTLIVGAFVLLKVVRRRQDAREVEEGLGSVDVDRTLRNLRAQEERR